MVAALGIFAGAVVVIAAGLGMIAAGGFFALRSFDTWDAEDTRARMSAALGSDDAVGDDLRDLLAQVADSGREARR